MRGEQSGVRGGAAAPGHLTGATLRMADWLPGTSTASVVQRAQTRLPAESVVYWAQARLVVEFVKLTNTRARSGSTTWA